jgi:hypothetical protein
MDWLGIDSGPPLRRTELLSDICLNEVRIISVFICIVFYKIALKRNGPRMAHTFHVNCCWLFIFICLFIYLSIAWGLSYTFTGSYVVKHMDTYTTLNFFEPKTGCFKKYMFLFRACLSNVSFHINCRTLASKLGDISAACLYSHLFLTLWFEGNAEACVKITLTHVN